jgi:hypothetical protein
MRIQFDNLTGSIEESVDFGGDGVILQMARLKIFELLTPGRALLFQGFAAAPLQGIAELG